jgi:Heterokaryon incompatibility protein (HET)
MGRISFSASLLPGNLNTPTRLLPFTIVIDYGPSLHETATLVLMSLYKQLADSNEIRLLYLLAGRKGEPIECTIKHHLFSSELTYEALSYEWGKSDKDLAPIQLDHSKQYVRENLWQALHHIRSEQQPRILWVDALCS